MDDGARDELRELRARAYGPGGDIADDPEAWSRLRELEDLERASRLPPPAVPAPPVLPEPAPVASPSPTPDDESTPDDEPRTRPPLIRSRRGLWLWAASLAVVVALASAATAASLSFVPVRAAAGAPQVDALVPDLEATTPPVFGQRTGSEKAFRDYYGVTAYGGLVQLDDGDNRSPCLYLLETANVGGETRGNFVYGGCGAGVFPATVQFVVAQGMPTGLVERFGIGASVQFVFDGENVGVFSDRG